MARRSRAADPELFDSAIAHAFETRLNALPESWTMPGRRPASTRWTAKENAEFLAMLAAGISTAVIALKLGRSVEAVKNRKNKPVRGAK